MHTLVLKIIINKQKGNPRKTKKQELRTKLRNKATVKQRPTPNN